LSLILWIPHAQRQEPLTDNLDLLDVTKSDEITMLRWNRLQQCIVCLSRVNDL